MNVLDTSSAAVVLKLEHYASLGIMRSLGRLGVQVYGVDRNPRPPASVSRYCSGSFVWDLEGAPPQSTIAFLCDVGKEIGRHAILIPTSDEMAALVADNAGQLAAFYRFPSQPSQLVHTLCSKKEMLFLSRQHGIPTPETFFPGTRDDVVHFSGHMSFPVVLKGINGALLEHRTGKKMIIAKDAKQLLDAYDIMQDPKHPNLMIQEYIPGARDADWIFNGYFNDKSDCLLALTGRKIRQNPVYTGMTSFGVCSWNQHLVDVTNHFMRAIGYRGIVDIDYRYDLRSQSYKILDLNPRIGATFRLFVTTESMDVARALYMDLNGWPISPSRPRDGRKWIVEDKDLLSSYRYFKDGTLNVRDWFASFRGIEEAGYFAADDPVPCLHMWRGHVQRRFFRNGSRPSTKGRKEGRPARTVFKPDRAGNNYEKDLHVFG